jgi:hypothetical protein
MQLSLPTICQETEKPSLSFLEHFLYVFFFPSLISLLFLFTLCPIRLLQLSNKVYCHLAELKPVLAFV